MLDVRFLSTEDQVTDGFTKPFSKQSQLDTKLRLMDDVRQEIELVSNSYVIDCVWLR
jgi:chaperonin cofactor prefoldin